MTKIYWKKTGSADSSLYKEYDLEEAKRMVSTAFNEFRIVVDMATMKKVKAVEEVSKDDILKVLPMVAGG